MQITLNIFDDNLWFGLVPDWGIKAKQITQSFGRFWDLMVDCLTYYEGQQILIDWSNAETLEDALGYCVAYYIKYHGLMPGFCEG